MEYPFVEWKRIRKHFTFDQLIFHSSAQVADLIGIYILDTLGRIVNLEQVELYWDDGIIFIPDSNGPKTSNIQKIIKAFKLKVYEFE